MMQEVDIQEMPEVVQGDPAPPDGREKLYKKLNEQGLYTKSFDDFKKQFSDSTAINKLYDKLNSGGLYSKGKSDFYGQFFSEVTKTPTITQPPPVKAVPVVQSPQMIGIPEIKTEPKKETFLDISEREYVVPALKKSLSEKTQKARDEINTTLLGHDDVKGKIIKERKFQNYATTIPVPKSDMPKNQSDIDLSRYTPIETKPYEEPVTPQELQNENIDIHSNEGYARSYLDKVGKYKPAEKQNIEKNIYLIDADNRNAQTPADEKKVNKVLKNAAQIENGTLSYDVRNGRLYRPEGFGASLITGWKAKNKAFDFYDYANSNSKESVIAELEKERNSYDPDEPIPVPKNKLSEVTQMAGGMPVLPMVAGTITGATGFPEAAPYTAAAVGGADMYRLGWSNEFKQSYHSFRQDGLSESESYDKAKALADKSAIADAAMGAAMAFIGGRAAGAPKLNFSSGYRAAAGTFLRNTGAKLKAATIEGLVGGGIGAAGQVYKNSLAKDAGINREIDEGVAEQIEFNLLMTIGIAAAAKAGRGLSTIKYRSLLNGLFKSGKENVDAVLNEQVASGQLTEAQASNVRTEIENYGELDKQIPDNVTEEARFKIQDKLKKRADLEEAKEKLNPAFHPDIKEKIAKLDEEINTLASENKETNRPTKQDNEIKNIIDDAIDEGRIPDVLAQVAKSDPDSFLKMIADQVHGKSEEGSSFGLDAEQATREQFGDEIVDKAKQLYPITPKTEENAVSIGKSEKTDVGEASGNSPEMEPRIPQPEESAGAQIEGAIPEEKSNVAGEKGIVEPRKVGITHAQMDNIAREYGLETYEKSPEKIAEWDEQAAKKIDTDPNAIPDLFDKLRKGELPDHVETRMMVQYMADLMAKIDKAPTDDALLTQLKRTKDLFNIAGRLQGKGLAARRGSIPAEERLGDFFIRDMEANKGAPLTEQQKETTIKEYEDISAAQKAYDEKVAKLEAENAMLRAEKEVKKTAASKPKGEKKDYAGERKQIFESIQEKLRKARGDTSVTVVPYAKELIAIAPDVAKLVRSLVEEGIEKLPEIVRNIHGQLKDLIPGITEKDVHNIIAGEYNEKKATRNEVAEKLYDLKTQAKNINRLEALENGMQPKNEKQRVKRNQEIEDLKQKIKEHDLTKLAALKSRTKTAIDKLEEQLKKGDFADEKKPVELDEEALKLKDQLRTLRQEREVRLIKEKYKNQSAFDKGKDAVVNVLNAPRSIMSSMDYSAPLRQGLVASVANPKMAKEALIFMFEASASEKVYDNWFLDLKESPDYNEMIESGLALTDPHDPVLSAHEEAFMSQLPEKIPFIGRAIKLPGTEKKIGGLIKGSERAYTGYLNKMRVDSFRRLTAAFKDDGRTIDNSPELYKATADYINATTGRGNMPEMLEKSAPLLNALFFSPRLIASRLQLLTNPLNPFFYKKVPKEIRVQYFKDMGKFILAGATVLGLAKGASALFGGNIEVEDDPRSTDFGKIKSGNTRWDIWGGFQQYVRLIAQVITGEKKAATSGEVKELNGEQAFGETRGDVLSRFGRTKLAPVPAAIIDLLYGRDVVGNEVTLSIEAKKTLLPLIYSDMKDAWSQQGFKSLFTVGLPAAFGVGVQTFTDKPKKEKQSKHSTKTNKKQSKRAHR